MPGYPCGGCGLSCAHCTLSATYLEAEIYDASDNLLDTVVLGPKQTIQSGRVCIWAYLITASGCNLNRMDVRLADSASEVRFGSILGDYYMSDPTGFGVMDSVMLAKLKELCASGETTVTMYRWAGTGLCIASSTITVVLRWL